MALELKEDGEITTVTDAELIADGDKETSYQVRHITLDKFREINRRHTKKVPNRTTHRSDEVTDYDAANDEILEYALAGWSGVTRKGVPVPCEREHMMLLDGPRREAILKKAGYNEVAAAVEARRESFRPLASVR